MSIPRSDSLMAFACVISPISRNTADLLIRTYLPQQVRQHGCVTNVTASHFNCPYLQRFFVDPPLGEWYIRLPGNGCVSCATDGVWGRPLPGRALQSNVPRGVLAGIPFPFALSLDASAVNEKV